MDITSPWELSHNIVDIRSVVTSTKMADIQTNGLYLMEHTAQMWSLWFTQDMGHHLPTQYRVELAEKYYDNKFIDYHIEFFRAGLNAIIKKWLNNGCKETPEEINEIITSEYKNKS